MNDSIDVSGIDHGELLAALHNGTCALGMGVLHDLCRDMTAEEAREILRKRSVRESDWSVDYVAGRPIKVAIRDGKLYGARLYDRDAGEGRCAEIVARLRSAK
jgi:hypothetical protein